MAKLTKKDTERLASKSNDELRVYSSRLKGPTVSRERATAKAELVRRREVLIRQLCGCYDTAEEAEDDVGKQFI